MGSRVGGRLCPSRNFAWHTSFGGDPPRGYMPHLAPSWIHSKAENLASSSLQDGATKGYYFLKLPPTHPTIWSFFEYLSKYHKMECAVYPPWLLRYLITLCGVPNLVWTSDHIPLIEMCGVPYLLKNIFEFCALLTPSLIIRPDTPKWDVRCPLSSFITS